MLSYTQRLAPVYQFSHLYGSDRAGTINVFPLRHVGMNSAVVGRHAGEGFGEKNGTQLYFDAGLRHGSIQTARNGSLPVTSTIGWLGMSVSTQPTVELAQPSNSVPIAAQRTCLCIDPLSFLGLTRNSNFSLSASNPFLDGGTVKKPFTFRPPKNNRILIALSKRALPLVLRLVLKIVTVEVNEADLQRLMKLERLRVVLTPSHGASVEPFILFHLSMLLGKEFNYVAAKEAFERHRAFGWLMQRVGAYSIVRGTADRESFRMTREILIEGKRWLVIFPEGEAHGQSDTLMPFQQGVAQFAFWGCEALAKRGQVPPLYFVPIAIKTVYLRDMEPEIDRSLWRLERKLFSTPTPQSLRLYGRLRRVGEAVLSAVEKEYNVRPPKDAELNKRVQHMKELILSRIESELATISCPERPLRDRVRFLFNAVDRIVLSELEGSEYEQQLRERRQEQASRLYDDLWQVLRFIAVHDGYVRESPTPERFLDLLGLLEWEVLKRRPVWGPRKAVVKIGTPLNAADAFPRYQADKREALQEVTMSLESSVRRMLAEPSG